MIGQYRGIAVVAGAIGIVSIASLLQLLRAPDGWAYDQAVRLGGWGSSSVPQVLIVESDVQADLTSDKALAVLNYLQQLGASQTVFLNLPSGINESFYQQASEYGNVIIGGPKKTSDQADGQPARPLLPVGALNIPPAAFGIHRRAATTVIVNKQELPTVAMLSAQHLGIQPVAGDFLINFNSGIDWIPRVSLDRVLAKGLITELVAGRTVIIGKSKTIPDVGLYTPINASMDSVSLLEFQAYAIDTLLQDKQIHTTPWILNLLMFGLIGLLSLMVYQWFNLDRSSWFTLLLVISYLGLGWLLLHALLVWIPVIEMMIAQILTFFLFVRFKLVKDDQEMRHTVLRRMARLQEYVLPPDFHDLNEHWARVITFLDQTLNLNRVILLERVKGDHRVREVQALRCSLQDIDERRRDFERPPYSDAIAEGGPIMLERRLFFSTPSGNPHDQYLVPLLFGGEVQGFWAFDVESAVADSSDSFLINIRNFAGQIAELLYHRHRWMEQQHSEKKIFQRFFRLDVAKGSSQEIGELLELLDNRLVALQAVFDGLATAAIQYDLFGRVIQLNSSMEEFMRQNNIPGYELTALDLLVAITGMPLDQARSLLRQVVIDRQGFLIPVAINKDEREDHSVHVKPLAAPEAKRTSGKSTSPFELAGILFELSDERGVKKRIEIREQLLEWMSIRIRDELNTFADSIATRHSESVNLLSAGVIKVLATLDQVHAALSATAVNASTSLSLADAYPLLFSAISEMDEAITKKKLTCNTKVPRLMSLIAVQPDQLRLLFRAILDTLITDAVASSELEIMVTERKTCLYFAFSNTGFGIPDEQLQAYLWQPEYGVTEEFKELREAIQPVADWGGEIKIHSDVGAGINVSLRLNVAK